MNEETTVTTEGSDLQIGVPYATEVSETVTETTDGTVETESTSQETTIETIWEDFAGAAIEETVAETTTPVITIEIIESIALDQMHVDLFGSFLVCGTLVGLALLRDRHGN